MIGQKKLLLVTSRSNALDLTELGGTATIQPRDLGLTLWVLSTPEPPSRILLPEALMLRRRLGRAGLMFAANRRRVPMEVAGRQVPVAEALGVARVQEPLPLDIYDFETSDRMRVVSKLERRRSAEADVYGRRYYWIDGLRVAVGHPEREFFDAHADQCLFELVDNVYRWARAKSAFAVVSATFGGGDQSHNRLQVVVADNGIGIIESTRRKARELDANGQLSVCLSSEDKEDEEIAESVISNLLEKVYGERTVVGARGGHGLNTINRHVSRWNGTMNVFSSFADSRVIYHGRRGSQGKWLTRPYSAKGIRGTLVHLTLNAVSEHRERSPRSRDRELVPA